MQGRCVPCPQPTNQHHRCSQRLVQFRTAGAGGRAGTGRRRAGRLRGILRLRLPFPVSLPLAVPVVVALGPVVGGVPPGPLQDEGGGRDHLVDLSAAGGALFHRLVAHPLDPLDDRFAFPALVLVNGHDPSFLLKPCETKKSSPGRYGPGSDPVFLYIQYIPPPPGGICGISFFSSGFSAMAHSVVIMRPATEAAFCSATRVTLVGSRIPPFIRSSNSSVPAL